ncbi:hypothetical protein GCM10009809_16780 [Isoptericola hypogeus]|uniref:CHAD domain-containing protein n=1 Tax=Isoptericola hypogeus TaxID=300179 RepID=A0ABN2JBC0_9MICO
MSRTAGEVLTATIRTRVDTILRREALVRTDAPDVVHRTRTGVRRLRSTLRTFAPFVDTDRLDAARLDDDLTRWGRLLGHARDAEVQRARLAAVSRDLDTALLPGVAALDAVLRRRHAAALGRVRSELDAPSHRDLVKRLRALAEDPPLREAAATRARPALEPRLDKAMRKVRRRSDRASGRGVEELHKVRKAARRARYAADVLASFGSGSKARAAKRAAKGYRAVQDLLGEHHDAAVLRETLAELRTPRTADAVDALDALEERRAREALAGWDPDDLPG